MTFIDTAVPAAQWASELLSLVSLVPVLVAVCARPRNAVYVSAEALTLLSLSSLVWPLTLGAAQLYLCSRRSCTRTGLPMPAKHPHPFAFAVQGRERSRRGGKGADRNPAASLPVRRQTGRLQLDCGAGAVLLELQRVAGQRGIQIFAGEPVNTSLAEAVQFQLTWLAAMLALHATMVQAIRVLMLYGFHPSKTPTKTPCTLH